MAEAVGQKNNGKVSKAGEKMGEKEEEAERGGGGKKGKRKEQVSRYPLLSLTYKGASTETDALLFSKRQCLDIRHLLSPVTASQRQQCSGSPIMHPSSFFYAAGCRYPPQPE